MKTPVVEVREHNLVVLTEFDGVFAGSVMQTRHNMLNNRIRYVIDSDGDLWSFRFVRTNHVGIRKIVSFLTWNISYDQYTYCKEPGISVGRFSGIVEPHQRDPDPDHSEMAVALIEALAMCNASDPLRRHVQLLNL